VKARLRPFISKFRSLRTRLFLSYILVGLVPMLIFGGIITEAVERHFVDERMMALRAGATDTAIALIDAEYMTTDRVARQFADMPMQERAGELNSRIIVANHNAYVLFDSGGTWAGRTNARPEILAALRGEVWEHITDDRGNMTVALPVIDAGAVVGAVLILHEMTDADQILVSINNQSVFLIMLLGGTVTVFVFLISTWLMRPLRRVLTGVNKISDGHLGERISLRGTDEFSALGDAVNTMASRLEQVETARQEFVSNVSHELKTPLSSIKVLSESLLVQDGIDNETYREFFTDINSEVDRMANIVNELLTLVRLDETELPLNIGNFLLNKAVADVVKRLRPLADVRNIEIEIADHRQVNIDGDEMKLNLAISNLIENAIKYGKDGGHVKIIIDADHKSAFLTIADNGIGIAEADQGKVFSRFYRVDKARDDQSGTGLGLAITHKTILLHNGSIRLNSKEGEGTTFLARIPLRQG